MKKSTSTRVRFRTAMSLLEHKDEGELDPMIADEEWIYIKCKDSDDADYGYITRSGELKKY